MRTSLTTPLALRRIGSTPNAGAARAGSTPGAFTLIEILVALAVLMLMLSIILVPINMGLNVFHIGKARSEVQQANQLVLNQLAAELKSAVFVFPNEEMPGITNKAPYTAANNQNNQPYYSKTTNAGVSNTARLDFLLPATNGAAILTPPQASNYIVTYYARRLDPDPNKAYDVFSNPIVLWRAQYPYRNDDGSAATTNLNSTRYPVWTGSAVRTGSEWLTQSNDEPHLESQSGYTILAVAASHTLLTPRDMALVALPTSVANRTRAELSATPTDLNGDGTIEENETRSYQPDSSFICDDINGDGKIDRVTISLLLQKYDSLADAADKSQQLRSTQTVALPNIK